MRPLAQIVRESATVWLLGGVLVLSLQGCTTEVSVKCGATGASESVNGDGVGACMTKFHGGSSAKGFWNDATSSWVPTTSTLTCSSGTVCKNSPGTCPGTSTLCINHINVGGVTGGDAPVDVRLDLPPKVIPR